MLYVENMTQEQLIYCDRKCPIGMQKREQFLSECESAFDAALDMWAFVDKCSKTCDIMNNWKDTKNG